MDDRFLKKSRQPIVIVHRGRGAIVGVSIEEHERSEHEREIFRLLAQGEREVAAGQGHDLEAVLGEADQMLAT